MMLTVNTKNEDTASSELPRAPEQSCRLFSVDEIQFATHNFDEESCIGRGGFGKVYKGVTTDGATNIFAIKRLHSLSDQGAAEFWVEVQMLSRLRHCNLVSLIGYCNDEKEMALVYEFMPHGTLSDHLHKKRTLLTWSQRLKICIGAARGLDYLHTGTGTQHGIIHRDVKSSNILLDTNYAAKISDFGLAKIGPTNQTLTYVSTGVKGTFGYMDPNYFYTGRLTRKSDVYSFGVVLLEVLCRRPALDLSLDEGLATWAQERIKQGKVTQITDSSLRDHISNKSLKEFSRIVALCLLGHPNQRPTMGEVISSLELALSFQEKKNSSARSRVTIEKTWSFLSLKAHFAFKTRGSTHTIEIKRVSVDKASNDIVGIPVITTIKTEVELDERGPLEGEDDNGNDPMFHTIESEEIDRDEAISENVSVLDQRGPPEAEDDLLPAIEGLRILGDACPGGKLQACGYHMNGATSCMFQWIHHFSDGTVDYIAGATEPAYTVGVGDVGVRLSVQVIPLDNNGRQGSLFKCFANGGLPLKEYYNENA